jgi:hypothetical protein
MLRAARCVRGLVFVLVVSGSATGSRLHSLCNGYIISRCWVWVAWDPYRGLAGSRTAGSREVGLACHTGRFFSLGAFFFVSFVCCGGFTQGSAWLLPSYVSPSINPAAILVGVMKHRVVHRFPACAGSHPCECGGHPPQCAGLPVFAPKVMGLCARPRPFHARLPHPSHPLTAVSSLCMSRVSSVCPRLCPVCAVLLPGLRWLSGARPPVAWPSVCLRVRCRGREGGREGRAGPPCPCTAPPGCLLHPR